jgi:hypothetical protein
MLIKAGNNFEVHGQFGEHGGSLNTETNRQRIAQIAGLIPLFSLTHDLIFAYLIL